MGGLVPFSKIFPPLVGSFVAAYVLDWLLVHGRVAGGREVTDMPTMQGSWKELEKERFLNMPREGAPDQPVIMNPMRHNIPAHIRNAEDLAAMSLDG